MTAGLVVAGGYSARFGIAEKALAEVGGEPMLRRIVRPLDAVVDHVVIDCREDQVAPFETALASSGAGVDPIFVVDDAPNGGPIAGLATGLDAIDDEETVVVSCDRPGVTPALFEYLRECRLRRDVDVAVPELDGFLQPLCGVYGTDVLSAAVDAALRSGDRRLLGISSALDAHVVTERSLEGIVAPGTIRSVDSPLEATSHPAVRRHRPIAEQQGCVAVRYPVRASE